MKALSLNMSAALLLTLTTHSLLAATVQQPDGQYVGELSQITNTTLTLDSSKWFVFDLSKAKCFDQRGDKTTCETLIGIGYANKARITVTGGIIQRVDVLELQQ